MKSKQYFVYDALKILMEISKNAQVANQESFKEIGTMRWTKEFCTVRASTSRRGGHTEAIMRLIEEESLNIGCFSPNHDTVESITKVYNETKEKLFKNPDVGWIYTFGNLEFCKSFQSSSHNDIRGRDLSGLDAIVFDNSFNLSDNQQNEIYRNLMPAIFLKRDFCPFYFIFL